MTRLARMSCLIAVALATGDIPSQAEVHAERFSVAHASGDDAAMQQVARDGKADPFRVAEALHAKYAAARLDGSRDSQTRALLAVLDSYVERVKTRDDARGLTDLVGVWRGMDAVMLRRHRRVFEARVEILRATAKEDWSEVLSIAGTVENDLKDARASPSSVVVLLRMRRALIATGKRKEALARCREAVRRAEDLRCFPAQVAALRRLARTNEAIGDLFRAGGAFYRLAGLCFDSAKYDAAIDHHRRAIAFFTEAKNRAWVAESLMGLGQAHHELGRIADAAEAFERALPDLETPVGRVSARVNAGSEFLTLGRYGKALDHLERAVAEAKKIGNVAAELFARRMLSSVYAHLGESKLGLECALSALAQGEATGDPRTVVKCLTTVCNFLCELEDLEQANQYLDRAFAKRRVLGANTPVNTLYNLAILGNRLGRGGEAQDLLSQALERVQKSGPSSGLAWVHLGLGIVLGAEGEHEKARLHLRKGVQNAGAFGNGFVAASCALRLAQSELALGAGRAAIRSAKLAVEMEDSVLSELAEGESFGLRNLHRLASDVGLAALRGLGAAAASLEEVFWFIEVSRGQLLAEGLVNRQALFAARLPDALRQADIAARKEVRKRQQTLMLLGSKPSASAEELKQRKHELDTACAELERVTRRVERAARRVAGVVHPKPESLAAVARSLPDRTALILYQLTGKTEPRADPKTEPDRVLAFVVGKQGAELFDLCAAEKLTRKVRAHLRLLSLSNPVDRKATAAEENKLARELHDLLLEPLARKLKGVQRLLIAPDGPLTFLPFEALAKGTAETSVRVVADREIAYVPSGTVYATLAQRIRGTKGKGEDLLALGDPVYPGEETDARAVRPNRAVELRDLGRLRRLPATGVEVRQLGKLFPDGRSRLLLRQRANLTELERALAGSKRLKSLHLACHGYLDPRNPMLTGLVLSGAEVLTLNRIMTLDVPAELVVLSGCDTGRGTLTRGEGVIGLVRGFFFAGAPRVVVSNWKVADVSTRELMTTFYERMLDDHPPARALRLAKMKMSQKGRHPFHWAGFVLWGVGE